MITPAHLATCFDRNVQIIKMQTAGLRQEESLIQLPFRGNCMNWIVGHLVTNRHNVLKLLGVEQPEGIENIARYARDSQPVTEAEGDVLQLEGLIQMLEQAQAKIAHLLANITPEQLETQAAFFGRRSMSVGEWLLFFYFHDSYHTGQTEILRQAAGRDDKII
jgi:uncharacterized damage-inducible protein DinB